ncbi:MAG TPA: SRPBCC family protein [Gemmatimonadaceae bacterium]
MKVASIVLGVVTALIVVIVAIGYSLPVNHHAQVTATIAAPPDQVYALITNVAAFPAWRTGVRSVEILTSLDGQRRWREVSNNGTIPYVVERQTPPAVLVTRIDSRSLPFGGTWTYELRSESPRVTRLDIVENGEIYNPIFRFVSRVFIGYDGTLRQYVSDVERKLGSPQAPIADGG